MPNHNRYIYNTIPTPKTQGALQERGRKIMRAKGSGHLLVVSSRQDRDVAPMKSQQYGYLNKTCIMTIPIDMPVWVKEVSQGLTSTAGNQ